MSNLAKRGRAKSKLTKLEKYFNQLTPQEKVTQVQFRLEKLEQLYNEFDDIQFEIEQNTENPELEEIERDEFESVYYKLVEIGREFISNQNPGYKRHTNHVKINNQSDSLMEPMKLPTINLPEFTGTFSTWNSFYATFNLLIENNDNLSELQKLYYLKNSVRDDAARAIESLPLSNENYSKAINILKARFENRRLTVQEHVHNILKIENINKVNNVNLRKLLDTLKANLESLKSLKIEVEAWDSLLIPLIEQKLDFNTNREWQLTLNKEPPQLNDFLAFLDKKCQLIDTMATNKLITQPKNKLLSSNVATSPRCDLCSSNDHLIYSCNQFLNKNQTERINIVKQKKLCFNCLRANHSSHLCKSQFKCRKCNKDHHTLLHKTDQSTESQSKTTRISENSSCNTNTSNHKNVLLSTAIILIKDIAGNWHKARALLDVGSQSNFITQSLIKKLNLPIHKTNISIVGISQTENKVNSSCILQIKSRINNYSANINCLVLPHITQNIPNFEVDKTNLNIPRNITLADNNFYNSSKIEILLGAEIFWDLLSVGQIRLGHNKPILNKTKLGWIIGGIYDDNKNLSSNCNLSLNTLEQQLAKFWEVETIAGKQQFSKEDYICEQHFITTHKRESDGRFVVELPFKHMPPNLGKTKEGAINRFKSIEHKFKYNPKLKDDYSNFINEYIQLNHMELVESNSDNNNSYYLPHHPVIKESSLTTKLRVVFDASYKSSNNFSLNDNLMNGPNLLQDLFEIILRFRTYQYVINADIVKMYRQIKVDKRHRNYQKIIWRNDINNSFQHYQLNTLTYGTVCAPYIAIRCLHQLAYENKNKFPKASKTILQDFYMDDLLTGCNTIDEAKQLKNDIINILSQGQFSLNKWASNTSEILTPNSNQQSELIILSSDSKTLGVIWNPKTDILRYSEQEINYKEKICKRSILSTISKLFDPLGLIGPVIILAKCIIQKLWLLKLDWDESIPTELHTTWSNFLKQLTSLSNISIPRKVIFDNSLNQLEIHGFCDASEQAYGCCIYIKHITASGKGFSRILCAKSRVAPVKQLSIPRLELCGALLLSQLLQKINQSLSHLKFNRTYLWTDSKIVLTWLNGVPSQWKTFVGNRVSEIQQITEISNWHHVKGLDNPADLISRGLLPDELKKADIWWHGPTWLSTDNYPLGNEIKTVNLDDKRLEIRTCHSLTIKSNEDPEYFETKLQKYSSYPKLKRILSYCLRFIHNTKNKIKRTGTLDRDELSNAELKILQFLQHKEFQSEIQCLKQNKSISKKSKLLTLSPFLDDNNLIRVGGRLKNSNLSFNNKHQIILPNHFITKLIIHYYHEKQFHTGQQGTLAGVRQRFWPLSSRSITRDVIFKCVRCFKTKPRDIHQLMGELPSNRVVIPQKPFNQTGVDYAGPFNIREKWGRGKRLLKSYIALFICLSTKAIHLELVLDLSTESFIAALKRFISRRGNITDIYSDNATNFVGANNELQRLAKNQQLNDFVSQENIKWHFIPPGSPHMGGIWEAGIKSVKHHLKRIVGTTILIYDELTTLLTQIEAILNSRPLTPLSSDPNDLHPLTPGHFLIGAPITAPAEPIVVDIPLNRLSRWQHIMAMKQHFWNRWSKEYLNTLQQRNKWYIKEPNVKMDDLVIIKNENTQPLQWAMGRVVDLHPDKDGIVRVISVRTSSGITKKAISRVCVLPLG